MGKVGSRWGVGVLLKSMDFGPGTVLRDAVSNGKDILRVDGDGEIKFGDTAAALTEDMVGGIMLIMVGVGLDSEDEKQSWLWESLCWSMPEASQVHVEC